MELNQPSNKRQNRDWIGPLFIFLAGLPIASIYGDYARTLELPTATLAEYSAMLMLGLVAISFFIPSQKLASLLWWLGIACIAYAPLLLWIGSVNIPLTRHLTIAESAEFKQQFPVRMVIKSSGVEGPDLHVKKHDYQESMKRYLDSIRALKAGQ